MMKIILFFLVLAGCWVPALATTAKTTKQIISEKEYLALFDDSFVTQAERKTEWLNELERKAKQITVQIIDATNNNSKGSGIIIAKDESSYYVLTVAHVVSYPNISNYALVAPDGKTYDLELSKVKKQDGIDLAVFSFQSKHSYQTATLADFRTKDGEYIFSAGYPGLNSSKNYWRFVPGQILGVEMKLSNENHEIARILAGGYNLAITTINYPGMSGGPILDSTGRVIGVYGRVIKVKKGLDGDALSTKEINYSLGIRIRSFVTQQNQFELTEKWLQLEPTNPLPLTLQQLRDVKEFAVNTSIPKHQLIGLTPSEQWIKRGNNLWRYRQYLEAIQAFESAIKLNPSSVHLAWYGQGRVLEELQKYSEALNCFSQATKINSNFYPAWQWQSKLLWKKGQYQAALIAIEKALKLSPISINSYQLKISILKKLKKYDEAILVATKAINIQNIPEFYRLRGTVYFEQQKWQLALADFNRVIASVSLDPEFAALYNFRGAIYQKMQKWQLALDDYNISINLNPKSDVAYYYRGTLYTEQEKWKSALADYTQAIAINPQLALAYYKRAQVWGNLGNKTETIYNLQRAAQLFQKQGNLEWYQDIMNMIDQIDDLI